MLIQQLNLDRQRGLRLIIGIITFAIFLWIVRSSSLVGEAVASQLDAGKVGSPIAGVLVAAVEFAIAIGGVVIFLGTAAYRQVAQLVAPLFGQDSTPAPQAISVSSQPAPATSQIDPQSQALWTEVLHRAIAAKDKGLAIAAAQKLAGEPFLTATRKTTE